MSMTFAPETEVIEPTPTREVLRSAIVWYELASQDSDGSWREVIRNFRILRQAGLMRPNRKRRS